MGPVKGYKKLVSNRVGFGVLLNYFLKPGGFSIGGDYSAGIVMTACGFG